MGFRVPRTVNTGFGFAGCHVFRVAYPRHENRASRTTAGEPTLTSLRLPLLAALRGVVPVPFRQVTAVLFCRPAKTSVSAKGGVGLATGWPTVKAQGADLQVAITDGPLVRWFFGGAS